MKLKAMICSLWYLLFLILLSTFISYGCSKVGGKWLSTSKTLESNLLKEFPRAKSMTDLPKHAMEKYLVDTIRMVREGKSDPISDLGGGFANKILQKNDVDNFIDHAELLKRFPEVREKLILFSSEENTSRIIFARDIGDFLIKNENNKIVQDYLRRFSLNASESKFLSEFYFEIGQLIDGLRKIRNIRGQMASEEELVSLITAINSLVKGAGQDKTGYSLIKINEDMYIHIEKRTPLFHVSGDIDVVALAMFAGAGWVTYHEFSNVKSR